MEKLLLYIVILLHALFVMFVVVTPFYGNNYFLMLHAIIVPFVMFHWYLNDNTCALTLMEQKIRQNLYGSVPDPNDCFTYRLIAPVYDFKKNNSDNSSVIYIITIALWFYTLLRLYLNNRNGKLSSLDDLVKY